MHFTVVGLLAVFALALAGCGSSGESSSTDSAESSTTDSGEGGGSGGGGGGDESVGVIFPGPIDDHSWNEMGFSGLERLEAEGDEVEYTASVAPDQQLEAITGYGQKGVDVVIAHGGQFMEDAERAGSEFGDTDFVVINGDKGTGNVSSVGFSYPESGYIAGALAAARTESDQVGIVAGLKLPVIDQAVTGFEAGAKSVNPDVEVKTVITGNFDDVDKAREQSLALVNNGVDVLWPILNAAETGVYSAAEDSGAMSIGFFGDVSSIAPKSYIGSPEANPGELVYAAGNDQALRNGKVNFLTVKTGQLGLAPLPEGTPAKAKKQVEAAVERLRTGTAEL